MTHKMLFLFTLLLPELLFGQKLTVKLDHLADKATEKVMVTLDRSLIGAATQWLQGPDKAKIEKAVNGLESILVRSFEFDKEGVYTDADIEPIRKELNGPGWSCIVSVRSKKESADVCLFQEKGKIRGLGILTAQPKELTVVNILGSVSLQQLGELEGQFGIPRLGLDEKKDEKKKDQKKDD